MASLCERANGRSLRQENKTNFLTMTNPDRSLMGKNRTALAREQRTRVEIARWSMILKDSQGLYYCTPSFPSPHLVSILHSVDGILGLSPEIIDGHCVIAWLLQGLSLSV
jgi:hypothetical protein